MFPLYSFLYTLAFILMLPLFVLRRDKYAAGFAERLGNYPKFESDQRPVIWLHCVSVGETNAARPLVSAIREQFPGYRLVVSTTTRTGQELARKIFRDQTDAIVYFPFDWKFSTRRALRNYRPSIVLLMETEIWPRFIHESKIAGAKVAIINGRLSERSFRRYSRVAGFVDRVLKKIDLALMQDEADAGRISALRLDSEKLKITGNLKFDLIADAADEELTRKLRNRFDISTGRPLIVAASTHAPEERCVLEALEDLGADFRLLIAPRHPERFDEVARLIAESGFSFVQRSADESVEDKRAQVILLDTIGELRAVYPLAEVVFVGGSLVRHGGQSVLEPAAAGRAIVTGPYTHNFEAVVKEFLRHQALIQLPKPQQESEIAERLFEIFTDLLTDAELRNKLGEAARSTVVNNRGATTRTVEFLRVLFD